MQDCDFLKKIPKKGATDREAKFQLKFWLKFQLKFSEI